MRVLPVLDLLDGRVVRGVAGRRTKYRPLVSQITTDTSPIGVANALREVFGICEIYLADLDGILYQRPNRTVYQQLVADGFRLLLDAGIEDAKDLFDAPETVEFVVGLESCPSPLKMAEIVAQRKPVTFSLDLQAGIPKRSPADHDTTTSQPEPKEKNSSQCWNSEPIEIARQAVMAGASSLIVLDLADVGMPTGGSTDCLCEILRAEFPGMRLISGGGVRGRADLLRLEKLGIDEVLVASALHDGRLSRTDLNLL